MCIPIIHPEQRNSQYACVDLLTHCQMGIAFWTRFCIRLTHMKTFWLEGFTFRPYRFIPKYPGPQTRGSIWIKCSTWRTYIFLACAYTLSSHWKALWVSHLHFLHRPALLGHQGLVCIRKDCMIYRIALSWTEIILWFLSTGRANQCTPSSKRFVLVILSRPLHLALLETLEPILGLLLSSIGCKMRSHSTSSSLFLYTQLPNSYNHFFQSSLISHTFIFHLNNQR